MQLTLFKLTDEERFWQFHRANPQVYKELRKRALRLLAVGHRRYSIYALFNVLRWHHDIKTVGDAFKINNNHGPFYERLLMEQEPELAGFFRTRKSANCET